MSNVIKRRPLSKMTEIGQAQQGGASSHAHARYLDGGVPEKGEYVR